MRKKKKHYIFMVQCFFDRSYSLSEEVERRVALIASSVLKLGKSTLKNSPSVCIFLGVLVLGELAGLLGLPEDTPAGAALNFLANPAVLVVLAGIAGWLLFRARNRGKEDEA